MAVLSRTETATWLAATTLARLCQDAAAYIQAQEPIVWFLATFLVAGALESAVSLKPALLTAEDLVE